MSNTKLFYFILCNIKYLDIFIYTAGTWAKYIMIKKIKEKKEDFVQYNSVFKDYLMLNI